MRSTVCEGADAVLSDGRLRGQYLSSLATANVGKLTGLFFFFPLDLWESTHLLVEATV